jgi:hypothetical protein
MTKPIGGSSGSPNQISNIDQTDAASAGKSAEKTEDASSKSAPTSSSPDHAKVTEHQFSGQMRSLALNAQAERELPAVQKNQQVDIHNPESRNQLLRSAPQVNDISKKAGNDGSICGGAATTNALILSSKTPEQAKANAKAVRDLAKSYDPAIQVKPEEEAALKRLESGKMSPTDVQHMQQLMDRVGHRMPLAGSNPSGMGLSTTQVACMMTKLSAHGAFQGADVKMHCNALQNGNDHWTVTVDRTFANSAHGHPDYDKSLVHGGPPPELQKGREGWRNEIILANSETPPRVYAQFKQGNDQNVYREAVFNTAEHKDPTSVGAFEKEIRRAAEAPATPIQ